MATTTATSSTSGPAPSSYPGGVHISSPVHDGFSTVLYQPKPPILVTPDYPVRQTLYSESNQDGTANIKRASIILSQEALSINNSSGNPSLAPRPGQLMNSPTQPLHTTRDSCHWNSSCFPKAKGAIQCLGQPPNVPMITSSLQPQQKRPEMSSCGLRLNKFVRRLHDMLQSEKDSGVVEWRRGLLVLYSTDAFAKKILPKYFNTRNFKTFRRQLNYYGFVHVRSFSTTGSSTTALWVNRDLAKEGSDDISSVLRLKRVEPCNTAKTAEGRRYRKELAIHTVEEDIGVSAKSLQLEQIRCMALRGDESLLCHQHPMPAKPCHPPIPSEVSVCKRPILSGSLEHHSHAAIVGSPPAPSDDSVSQSAANVLLMLSRS